MTQAVDAFHAAWGLRFEQTRRGRRARAWLDSFAWSRLLCAFMPAFGRAFQPPFATAGAAAAPVSWWLSGSIAAANCLAAYTPKGAANLAASYDNNAAPGNGLPDGTYDAAPGIAPAWAAGTGWTFDGASTYLTTGVTPPNTNTWSFVVRCDAGLNNSRSPYGQINGSMHFILANNGAGGVAYSNGDSVSVSKAPAALTDTVLACVGAKAFRNGIDEGVALGSWGIGATMTIYIGAVHRVATITNYWDGVIVALAIYNTVITDAQALAVATAMAAL